MITNSDLAMMRQAQNAILPETVEIVRGVAASDGAGGRVITKSVVATTSGRIAEMSADDVERYGRLAISANFIITLPVGVDVRQSDQVKAGGNLFEIISVLPHSYQTALRLAVKKL